MRQSRPFLGIPPSELWMFLSLPLIGAIGAGGPTVVATMLIEPIQAEFGWSAGEVSQLAGVYFLGGAVASLLVGGLLDRIGARVVMACSTILLAISLLLIVVSSDRMVLQVLFGVMGVAVTGASVTPCCYVATRYITCSLALAVGVIIMGVSLGVSLISILFGAIVQTIDWRVAIIGLCVASLVVILPLTFRFVPRHVRIVEIEEAEFTGGGSLAGVPIFALLLIILGQVLFGLSTLGMIVHLVPILIERGYETSYGWIFGAINFIPIASMFLISFLDERCGTLAAMGMVLALGAFSYGVLLYSGNPLPLGSLVIFGLAWGTVSGAFAQLVPVLVSKIVPTAVLGLCIGVVGFVDGMAGTLGPIAIGYIADGSGGYDAAVTAMIGLTVLAAFPLAYLATRMRKEMQGLAAQRA